MPARSWIRCFRAVSPSRSSPGWKERRLSKAGLTRGDLSARAFRTFDARQRDRYRSFRRFVRAFYTLPFRDLFFTPNTQGRMFRAIITVLAGY